MRMERVLAIGTGDGACKKQLCELGAVVNTLHQMRRLASPLSLQMGRYPPFHTIHVSRSFGAFHGTGWRKGDSTQYSQAISKGGETVQRSL